MAGSDASKMPLFLHSVIRLLVGADRLGRFNMKSSESGENSSSFFHDIGRALTDLVWGCPPEFRTWASSTLFNAGTQKHD